MKWGWKALRGRVKSMTATDEVGMGGDEGENAERDCNWWGADGMRRW